MFYKSLVLFFYLSLVLFSSCSSNKNLSKPLLGDDSHRSSYSVPAENCQDVSDSDKMNPLDPGNFFSFYTMAEDSNRFSNTFNQDVYVIGDIHGSWEMVLYALVSSGVMELDKPDKKKVSLTYQNHPVVVEIPNLKFKGDAQNKVIFLGDYIDKNDPWHEQMTLALLNDVLTKQSNTSTHSVVALIGNHDLEAVNGITRPRAYLREKQYRDQIMQMIQHQLLAPTYSDHGIWYSHSYLTPDDMRNFQGNGIDFLGIQPDLIDQGLARVSAEVNQFIQNQMLSGRISETWLASTSEHPNQLGPFNFYYVMSAPAANRNTVPGGYQNFPIIMGHLSDLRRKVPRVLIEGYGGVQSQEYAGRDHILCVDTAIYHSFREGTPAGFLKIQYGPSRGVQFQQCTYPTV